MGLSLRKRFIQIGERGEQRALTLSTRFFRPEDRSQPRARDIGTERRVSTGGRREDASTQEAKRIRVDIAGGLSSEGFWSGPRSVLAHRRGPLSVCRGFVFFR